MVFSWCSIEILCCCCIRDSVSGYEDFASSSQLTSIRLIRKMAKERVESTSEDDNALIQRLWSSSFPTITYPGRQTPRWKDMGFQGDDPTTDFRGAGRVGLHLLLYFVETHPQDFQRLIHVNSFPFAACAINVAEILIVHFLLRLPQTLICPCCGTGFAHLQLQRPVRPRPELRGFIRLLSDTDSIQQTGYKDPLPEAFCMIFAKAILVLEQEWKTQLLENPHTNLLEFGQALGRMSRQMQEFVAQCSTLQQLENAHGHGHFFKFAS